MSVVVKAAFDQHWRGNHYHKHDTMPATKEQGLRLTKSGQGYYALEDSEVKETKKSKQDLKMIPHYKLLEKAGYTKINEVSFASDEDLLSVDGIGQEKLKDIRGFFD